MTWVGVPGWTPASIARARRTGAAAPSAVPGCPAGGPIPVLGPQHHTSPGRPQRVHREHRATLRPPPADRRSLSGARVATKWRASRYELTRESLRTDARVGTLWRASCGPRIRGRAARGARPARGRGTRRAGRCRHGRTGSPGVRRGCGRARRRGAADERRPEPPALEGVVDLGVGEHEQAGVLRRYAANPAIRPSTRISNRDCSGTSRTWVSVSVIDQIPVVRMRGIGRPLAKPGARVPRRTETGPRPPTAHPGTATARVRRPGSTPGRSRRPAPRAARLPPRARPCSAR